MSKGAMPVLFERPMRNAWNRLPSILAGMAFLFATTSNGQATDLIISEYVEGSSNNKYIELYNGTAAAINLADYELRLYANGAAVPGTTNALSGSLAAGATIVYRNSAATIYLGATTIATVCNFNGDDAIALWKVSTSSFVDIFGNIGCDPGTAWTATGISTLDRSLVRNTNICAGVTIDPATACPFPTLGSEWTNNAIDVVANLGSHTMTCGPTVTMAVATASALESAGSATITLNITPATTAAETVTIGVVNGAGAIYTTDYTTNPVTTAGSITRTIPAGATSATFTVNIVDDVLTEANETITFTITGASAGISLGSALVTAFTIVDNDVTPTIDFSTLNITVLETAGTQTFNFSINPAAPAAGSFTLAITNGPGACYGFSPCDYFTAPAQAAGIITVSFLAGATTASFNATVINDLNPESTEQVTFTLSGVPTGFAIGSNNIGTLVIGDNDSPTTVLDAGDLVIVGVNSNTFACGGGTAGEDQISFFCFKTIEYGTSFMISDNGYSRCTAGLWGNNEGTVLVTRTGLAIPAGQVITLRITNSSGPTNVQGVAPDANWSCATLNGFTTINLNSGGDQLFFGQGGVWTTNTIGSHDATYSGSVIYGSPPTKLSWSALCGSNQRSDLPPGLPCFSMAPTLATDFNKYIGPMTAATQRDWVIRVDDQTKG
ncbi:MAG: lamin tail domain-containing protein [Flavobacteriales bacterium]|nr:lamin tail domain-containing protein [Flavobacteriales bacterium]